MDKVSYNPLLGLNSDVEEQDDATIDTSRRNKHSSPWARYRAIASIAFPWLLSAVLTCIIIYPRINGADRFHQHKLYASQLTFSPAQDEIEYELTRYHTNIVDAPPEFQGPPSERLDKAWDDIFNFGISTISEKQARLMTNYTSPVPNHEDEYIVELDVFHQLHCLNMFRKAFTPIYLSDWEAVRDPDLSNNNWTLPPYPFEKLEENRVKNSINPWHIGHCMESLRQSIMCHGDVTPAVWHWDKNAVNPTRNKPWLDVPHTCRNFDRIREWGLKHKIRWDFDYGANIPEKFSVPSYP